MKKFYIVWILLCLSAFAMDSIEDSEAQSWLPKWADVKTYMGFGISCETKIPSHAPLKAAYGIFSMLLGASEIYTANQMYSYDQSPAYSVSNIRKFILNSHGTSTFIHGGMVLVDVIPEMILNTFFGYSQKSIQEATDQTNAIYHMGPQLIAALGLVHIG